MGKTSKVFDNLDKDTSVRDPVQKGLKKKKRKRDLDNLRQQVFESKHAMQKNPNKAKARKTSFGKTLADFAEKRQAIDSSNQLIGKVKKQDQKKICSKLLADPFIGLFKNGARGNEVNREHEFFNETDKARFNGNVIKLLRGDDPSADKMADGLHDKTSQTSPEPPKESPILVKTLKNKWKLGLNKGKKGEKCDQISDLKGTLCSYDTNSTEKLEEVSEEDQFDSLVKICQTKFGNETAELRQKLVDHESLSIERCKQICNTISRQIAPENWFITPEGDPLQKTRSSLKRLYADSHRQHLLRNKVQLPESEKLPTPSSVEPIKTPRLVRHLKVPNEKSLFLPQLRSNDTDDCQKRIVYSSQATVGTKSEVNRKKCRKETVLTAQEPSSARSSSEIICIPENMTNNLDSRKDRQLFHKDVSSRFKIIKIPRKLPNDHIGGKEMGALDSNNGQGSKHAFIFLRQSHESVNNIFKKVCPDIPQDSPINLSQFESKDSIKQPKTPNAKKVSLDEQSNLLKSKLNFMAAKRRPIQSRITTSPGNLHTTGKAEVKRRHVLRFQDLFKNAAPYNFAHTFQVPHANTTSVPQDPVLQQRRNSSDFKSQVINDDEVPVQNRNIQGIHQKAPSDCHVILLQSQPENFAGNSEDIERQRKIQFYENPQRPLKFVPTFFSSTFQNLPNSQVEPEKSLTAKQTSGLNIMNGVENLNLLANSLSQPDIDQASSSNAQTHHGTSQPIKFIAIESDQQVQRRIPIYFHEKKPYIAYFPPGSDLNQNNIRHSFFSREYVEPRNVQVRQSKPRVVSCIQCANSASGTVFCYRDVSTVPSIAMAHQQSFQAQDVYHIDKSCNATVPDVRFIKSNNVQHGVKVLGLDESHGRNYGLYVTGRQDL